jgi:enoyl-CoA hydratase
MSSALLRDHNGTVTTLTLNRPEIGNRLTNQMADDLRRMIGEAANSRVIVLRGAGDNFCLGRELPPDAHGELTAIEAKRVHTDPILNLCAAFENSPVPIVGVVQGKAMGGATAIAAMCDITLASDDAVFQLPEMHHGIPPCLAMSALAPRVLRKAIVHMVYSTDPIDAATALAIGLVSRVVPRAELDAAASALVSKIAHYDAAPAAAVKQYMRFAPGLDSAAAAELAGNLLANVVSSRR